MDIDFLEIGTSNFETLLQEATDDTIGISVEPVKYYLDSLPDRKNIIKVNTAITSYRTSDTIQIYYIPENIVDEKNLGWWIKGCNSINTYHPLHIRDNIEQYVTIDTVPLINIDEFLVKYDIRSIKYLKIDTEGHDSVILNGLFDYLKNKPLIYYPHKIMFESNLWTESTIIDRVIERSIDLGYEVISRGDHDTILVLKDKIQ